MTRILLIKSSSLGDVIHCLPAVSDMSRQVPDLSLDWVIEESLADVARLHPAVTRVIPVQLRRWRRHLLDGETWREFGLFRSRIGAAPYDRIIDAQGLIRSAMLARLAAGLHCGYDRHSVREPPASLFYDRRYPAGVTLHAVERMRRLAAQAIGYEVPAELDYGVRTTTARPEWLGAGPYLVGLHATARADKAWFEERWAELARRAAAEGFSLVLPWGSGAELRRSERIAAASPLGVVPPSLGFAELAALLAGAAAVVGVDTGLTHLASAVGAPVVAIYAATWSEFNGVIGAGFVANLGGPGTPPSADEAWTQTLKAVESGRKVGAWRAEPAEPAPELAGRRRFRPSNARAVVHRR
ncbi:MAG TPA: lipopolysaccharide heptosyltransferase I [Caulobacteraceae bacterium]|nr:lipopolysaccharide heptosyltransferase I [Caulobacteraceae bacterium]